MPQTLHKIGLIIAFIPLAISLVVFPLLPDTIPTHFSSGTPDAWSDKWGAFGITALFALPLMSLVMCGILYRTAPSWYRIAGEAGQAFKNPKHMEMIIPSVAALILIMHIMTVCLLLNNV
ncbi:MAG: DUF1648 domain-containing protein [Candidatus Methanoplasma sp.]|jgi:uncharacterized membrane protein|nr:DUF1648 domain-containing protein [Candidatus Methanoplasma sp.]